MKIANIYTYSLIITILHNNKTQQLIKEEKYIGQDCDLLTIIVIDILT